MIEIFKEMGYAPLACVWELTLRCNLDCVHCGSRAGAARSDELSIEQTLDVADQLAALGNQRTTLSGGEPLLFKEWPRLAARLVQRGVKVNMISNGFAMTERAARSAREAGLSNIAFSLDGDRETHNAIRRHPESYDRVLTAVKRCQDQGLEVGVITHVIKANKDRLEEMLQRCLELGLARWQVQLGFDFGNLSDHPDLLVEPEDLKQIVPEVARLMKTYGEQITIHPADDMGYYTEEEELFRGDDPLTGFWLGCRAGLQLIGIEANGNVKGCLSMQDPSFVEGNLTEDSLETIWTREGAFAFTREFRREDLGGFCAECQYLEFCRGGCTWNGLLHGDLQARVRANRYCLYQVLAKEEQAKEEPPAGDET